MNEKRVWRGKQMKKLQKALAVLLAGSMVMAAGCGGRERPDEEPAAETQEEKPGLSEDQNASDDPGTAGDVPQIRFTKKTADDYDETSGQWLLHVEYQTAEVTKGGTGQAAQAVLQWSENRNSEIEGLRTGYAKAAARGCSFRGTHRFLPVQHHTAAGDSSRGRKGHQSH